MKTKIFCFALLMVILNVGLVWGAGSDIFVLGDTSTPPSGYTYTKMTIYSSDRWTVKANMPTARGGLAAVAVNGKIYAIGGSDGIGGALKTTEEYDPATNTWSAKADMPTAREGLAAVAVNGKIYVIGGGWGWFNESYLNKTEKYNPVTNKWTVKANMPTGRGYLAAVAVNRKIYAIGGWNGSGALKTTEEYDPATNTWSAKADMPTSRCFLAVADVNRIIYAIGGMDANETPLQGNAEFSPSVLFYIHRQD